MQTTLDEPARLRAYVVPALRAAALVLGGLTFAAAALGGAFGGPEHAGRALALGFIAAAMLWRGLPLARDLFAGPLEYEGVVLAVRPGSSVRPRHLVAELSVPAVGRAILAMHPSVLRVLWRT